MRRVWKARIVPDSAPDGMVEKVIKLSDLGVPLDVALGNLELASFDDLMTVKRDLEEEIDRRLLEEPL